MTARRPVDLAAGHRISDRYVLERRAWDSEFGPTWLARDEVLERTVLIQTVPALPAEAVTRAVARTVQVTHPGLSQIYDVCADPLAIVLEHAPGGRLADRKEGAMPPPQAASVVCQLAAAISALHERGLAHGAIGPGNVLFDEEGRPKLAGVGLASETDGTTVPEGYRPREDATPEERDRYGLAAVAYRLFTGRAPGADAPPPRTARKNVPSEVDALLSRALAHDPAHRPGIDEFRRVLAPLAAAEPPERGPGFFRQEASWLVPVLLVVGLAAVAIVLGVRTGALKIGGGKSTPQPSPSTQAFKVVSPVLDFDPEGDGTEHPDQTRFAIDGTDKAWTTLGYRSANLGGLKTGVGLLFDLGAAQTVGRIEVRTPLPGWRAEWRVADVKGNKASDYRLVDEPFTADGKARTFSSPVRARYWLLWITRLVDNGTGANIPFLAQVQEVTFFPR